ncbi:MAG TPA: phosphatase PAP2 family protein [Proteiniclasticum sp.]|nr:phosphatase PAP2 family protein [Proteiniclasticum sp.]
MELDFIRAVQSIHNPFLDAFFEAITILGEEIFIVPLLLIIFWSVNKKFGEILAFTVFTSYLLNNSLKEFFSFERPIGEEGIRTLRPETATGKSFPSGHSQSAAATAGAFSLYLKNRWVTIVSLTLMVLVGLSRLYLGVHYPKDAIVGILLGLLVALICSKLFFKVDLLKMYLVVLILFLPALFFAQSTDFIKSLASYLGFFLGILLEKKKVNFSTDGPLLKKVLRVVFGLILVLLIKEGLKGFFPETDLFDFIRYFLVTFVAIGIYPWLFKKIRL